MAKDTIHQKIWKKTDSGLVLSIPKIINSDIGFQLMFGKNEDYDYEQLKVYKFHQSYCPITYNEKELKDIFK